MSDEEQRNHHDTTVTTKDTKGTKNGGQAMAVAEVEERQRPLTPLDYQQLLVPFNPKGPKVQPEADYWRKTDKQGHYVTGPIMRHTGVQKLARLFGVKVAQVNWLQRDTEKLQLTCEITVEGYSPLHDAQASAIVGWPVRLATDYAFAKETTGIGELNQANAGPVGKQFPQCLCYKRALDRAVLEHLGIQAYGESEAPSFAQGADYEESPAQPAPTRSNSQPSPDKELALRWKDMPQDIKDLATKLVEGGALDKPRLARICMGCNWEDETIREVLVGLEAKSNG